MLRDKIDHTEFEIKQWSSHKIIFEKLWPVLGKVNLIVELGAGLFSTSYLAKHCYKLVSLENNKDWHNKIAETLTGSNIKHIYWKEEIDSNGNHVPTMHLALNNYKEADIVFIDQDGDRHLAVKIAMEIGIPHIVIHDFSANDAIVIKSDLRYSLEVSNHFNPTGYYKCLK